MEVNLKLKLKDEEELDSIGSKKELKIPNVSDDRSIVAFLELELLSDGKFTQVSSSNLSSAILPESEFAWTI